MEELLRDNLKQEDSYGMDSLSIRAREQIRQAVGISRNADVHFVTGGTQANRIVLAAMMKPYQSVIAANTAHINVHEAGAIESTGHKINTVDTVNGKLTIDQLQAVLDAHTDEHMVQPKVVFLSNSTEVGTVYGKKELREIGKWCLEKDKKLYIDGARLGTALVSKGADLDLREMADWADAFYIGGTKNGALLGEALVILSPQLKEDFRFHLKQHGALLAKSRVLGAQFSALFRDDLFFKLAEHANQMAEKLRVGIEKLGYNFLVDSSTNQIFPILDNQVIAKLSELYGFYVWKKIDENKSAIRLVTSWATKEEMVDEFLFDLEGLSV